VLARTSLAVIGLEIGDDKLRFPFGEPASQSRLVDDDGERLQSHDV
jgi:hypothetical protein